MTQACEPSDRVAPAGFDRRKFLALASALGMAAVPGVLVAAEKASGIDAKTLAEAEKLTGLEFTDAKRALMLKGLDEQKAAYAKLRAVHLPNGFKRDGTPWSLSFVGKLFGEGEVLVVAKAYQDATGFHLRHPKL